MYIFLLSGNIRAKWKRFVCRYRKNFNFIGTFGICLLYFEVDCFIRVVYVKGIERRIKLGLVLIIWKVIVGFMSERSRRRVSVSLCIFVNKAIFIQRYVVIFKFFLRFKSQYIFVSNCLVCIILVNFEFLSQFFLSSGNQEFL